MDDYGLILTNVFQDTSGLQFKFEIYDRESGDSNSNIEAGSTPAKYNWDSVGVDLMPHGAIIAGSLDVELIAATASQYTSFLGADDKRYACKFYYYNGASYDEQWRGYMIPSFFSKTWGSPPLIVYLKFSDQLGDLQNIPYATDSKLLSDPTFYGGFKSLLDIICFCLRELDTDINSVKVGIDLFSDLYHDNTSTDTPLEQTYLDTNGFFDTTYTDLIEEVDFTQNMGEVIAGILSPFGASIIQWEGSYWIVDMQAWESNTTFSYVEYDIDGTYVTNSTRSNIYDFDTSTSSDRWRWMGEQTMTGTSTYQKVDLELIGSVVQSLTPALIRENAFFLSFFPFSGTWNPFGLNNKPSISTSVGNNCDLYIYDTSGRVLTPSNLNSAYIATIPTIDKDLISPDEPLVYAIGFKDQTNSSTYLEVTDSIEYDENDKVFIDVEYKLSDSSVVYSRTGGRTSRTRVNTSSGRTRVNTSSGRTVETGPRVDRGGSVSGNRNTIGDLADDQAYFTMKWRWQVGSYYYNAQEGTWSASIQTNSEFVTDFSENKKLSVSIPFRSGVSKTSDTYSLKVWAVSPVEFDISGATEATIIQGVKNVVTTTLDPGARLVCQTIYTSEGNPERKLYFYELTTRAAGSEPEIVVPTDNASSNLVWRLAATKIVSIDSQVTTEFSKFDIIPLPKGKEVDETLLISRFSNDKNTDVLTTSLSFFDFPGSINNSANIYRNIFRANTDIITYPPIEDWIDSAGDEHKIQTHYQNRLLRLANTSRWKIAGQATYNSKPSPMVVYRVPTDSNRRFLVTNGSIDYKKNTIDADFVELIADNPPTVAEHEKLAHDSSHS